MKKILLSVLVIAFLAVLAFWANSSAKASSRLTFQGKEYTNLCGSGTAANCYGPYCADTPDYNVCPANCDPNAGYCSNDIYDSECTDTYQYCSTNQSSVVKYTCEGRVENCENPLAIEEEWGTSMNFDGWKCDRTYQIDVFNTDCRNGGCNSLPILDPNASLKGYMVWYSGACAAEPTPTIAPTPTDIPPTPTPTDVPPTPTPTGVPLTPTPTGRPSVTPTPTTRPNVTPTPTRRPSVTPTPTTVPQGSSNVECPSGTVFGGIQGSTIICVSQNQVQDQDQIVTANSNAETGPINVTLSTNAPQVVTVPRVITVAGAQTSSKELPKTGLPMAAWALSGFLPIGAGLRRFGKNSKTRQESANFIWQTREFSKEN